MRIEERDNNHYVKKPDVVDSYVLKIIQRYFETNEDAILNSREDIINEATRRIRPEIVFSIQKTVIEETKKYAQEELNNALDNKLIDIMSELREQVTKMLETRIGKAEFKLEVDTLTYDVSLPVGSNIHSTIDLVSVYVNGSLADNHRFVSNANGMIDKITFEPDLLLEGDVISVKCIILHQ